MNETLEVEIEKIVPNGFGLARVGELTVFVALAAVGDCLRVRINKKQKNLAFASIIEIIKPSPFRSTPECRYFGTCGGCNFQQMNYAAQLEAKVAILRDCLERIGKFDYPHKIKINSADAWNYRTRTQIKIDLKTRKIGYFKRNSHEVCDVAACPILTETLQANLSDLRENIRWEDFWENLTEIEISQGDREVSVKRTDSPEKPRETCKIVGEFKYFYNADCFFQVNHALLEKFVNVALQDFHGEDAEFDGKSHALDLYCGVGLFSLPLARRFEKVFGVESGWKAVDFAKKNATENGITNIGFLAADVSVWLAENLQNLCETAFVLLDPPREGAEKTILENLLKLSPKRICYVSCEPSTLARDLRVLSEKYEIESIEAFDFFPQTHHVETVVQLKHKGNSDL